MFSLIVVLISIALVAALAVATMYFGGTAWTTGSAKAAAAQTVNESVQITGAVAAYTTSLGSAPADLDALITAEYLTAIPPGDWRMLDGAVAKADLTADQCLAANAVLGISTVPSCSDTAYAGQTVCCSL